MILTKPIGTGIVGTAIKFGRAPEDVAARAVAGMRALNRAAAEAVADLAVHACTDVTGFGLLGHASEMAIASGVSMAIDAAAVPVIEGILPLVAQNTSGGLHTNRSHFGRAVAMHPAVPPVLADLLFDPQTSGGLLLAMAPGQASLALVRLAAAGVQAALIGNATAQGDSTITVR